MSAYSSRDADIGSQASTINEQHADGRAGSVLSGERLSNNADTSGDGGQVYPVRASIELFGIRFTMNSHFGMTDLRGENYVGSVRRIIAVLLKRIAGTLVPDNVDHDVNGMEV